MTTAAKTKSAAQREDDAFHHALRLLRDEMGWSTDRTQAENWRERARIWRRLERLASVGCAEALQAAREAEERE